jgi:hypothetical protein
MWRRTLLALLALTLSTGCSDDSGGTTGPDADEVPDVTPTVADADEVPDIAEVPDVTPSVADADEVPDIAEVPDVTAPDAADPPDEVVTSPDAGPEPACPVVTDLALPAQAGVAYLGHYHTAELRWYRTDGEHPTHAGTLDTTGFTHDMALNPVTDLLAVAHDIGRNIELFQLDRPESVDDAVDAPTLAATIDLGDDAPRRVAFDVARDRLYIVCNAPLTGGELLTSMLLHVYDTSDPANPVALTPPQTIPVTTSLAIDPYAGMLGLIDLSNHALTLYDASAPTVVAFSGDPIDLRALYPQESSSGFQPRNLRFDPANGRVLIAREQTALSEVIALSYPSVLASDAPCPPLPAYVDFAVIVDGFDVDQAPQDWDNLLGAYDAIPVPDSDAVMFIAEAWNGTMASSIVIPLDGALTPQTGCGDYAGAGCFYQGWVNGSASSYQRTDGAACVDGTHGVVVGTSVSENGEGEPGGVHLFRYDEALVMTPWPTESGGGLAASGLPIATVCH